MSMDDFSNRFLELLKYVPYIKDEMVKIKIFLCVLPQPYKDRIEFDEKKN